MSPGLPILWSFRRCPYAIRARLALRAAGVEVEVREVSLQAKPPELMEASPKGTVPVLEIPAGSGGAARVIEQSLEVMRWALERSDPQDLLRRDQPGPEAEIAALIATNDGPFKQNLNRFKYASRVPPAAAAAGRRAALAVLHAWNDRLQTAADSGPGGWLLGPRPCLADLALLPFVRQFHLVDPAGFQAEPDLEALRGWLGRFLASPELAAVMTRQERWRSSRFLYHLALADEWQAARAAGVYRRSTRGRSLEEVGFVHASWAHQVGATYRRFYADAGPLRLLTIDPQRLTDPVRAEAAPGSGELFPHLHGPLPLEAVVRVEPYPA